MARLTLPVLDGVELPGLTPPGISGCLAARDTRPRRGSITDCSTTCGHLLPAARLVTAASAEPGSGREAPTLSTRAALMVRRALDLQRTFPEGDGLRPT